LTAQPAARASKSKLPLVVGILGGLLAAVAITIGLVVALSGEEEEVIGPNDVMPAEAQARAAAFEATLAAIRRIDADRAPRVAVDGYTTAAAPTFVERNQNYTTSPTETTILVYPDDLRDPGGWKDAPFTVPHSDLAVCMNHLKAVRGPAKRSYPPKTLEGCTTLKHLVVVRNISVVPPTIPDTTVEGNTRTYHMKKGTVQGEALVFDIATGRSLGGFRFAAESSPEPPNANLGAPQDLLNKDLEARVLESFKAAASQHRRP
jgi:hypothetical protein